MARNSSSWFLSVLFMAFVAACGGTVTVSSTGGNTGGEGGSVSSSTTAGSGGAGGKLTPPCTGTWQQVEVPAQAAMVRFWSGYNRFALGSVGLDSGVIFNIQGNGEAADPFTATLSLQGSPAPLPDNLPPPNYYTSPARRPNEKIVALGVASNSSYTIASLSMAGAWNLEAVDQTTGPLGMTTLGSDIYVLAADKDPDAEQFSNYRLHHYAMGGPSKEVISLPADFAPRFVLGYEPVHVLVGGRTGPQPETSIYGALYDLDAVTHAMTPMPLPPETGYPLDMKRWGDRIVILTNAEDQHLVVIENAEAVKNLALPKGMGEIQASQLVIHHEDVLLIGSQGPSWKPVIGRWSDASTDDILWQDLPASMQDFSCSSGGWQDSACMWSDGITVFLTDGSKIWACSNSN